MSIRKVIVGVTAATAVTAGAISLERWSWKRFVSRAFRAPLTD